VKISSVNTERTLMNISSSIGKSPSSWVGWHALYIPLNNIDEAVREDCLLWTRSIAQSYLNCLEGHVFFCQQNGVHIICRNVQAEILNHAGAQICELIEHENNEKTTYHLYNLGCDGSKYVDMINSKVDNVFCLPAPYKTNRVDILQAEPQSVKTQNIDHVNTRRVLLVEDDPVTRWIVRNTLKGECDLMTASYGNKVFSLYSTFQPHLIFLDINLPDQNGTDLLDWILGHDPGAQVVMFSSDNSLQTMTSTFEQGATGFISKPFLKSQLLEYIHGAKHAEMPH